MAATLLVIESAPALRFALERVTLLHGLQLEFATLEQALARAPGYDAILADDEALLAPGEVLPLAALKAHHQCPIVLLTASGNPRLIGYARQNGAAAVLAKPCALAELRATLAQVLGQEAAPAEQAQPAAAAHAAAPAVAGRLAEESTFDELFVELQRRQPLPEGLDAFEVVERHLIRRALQACEGNQSHTARFLGITRNTLRKRIAKYGFGALLSGEPATEDAD